MRAALLVLVCACSTPPVVDAGVPGEDAGVDAGLDAGLDAGALEPTPLPLADASVISAGPELDYQSALLPLPDGGWLAVFERFSTTAFAGHLRQATSPDLVTFAPSEPLPLSNEPLVAGPQALGRDLYFMAGDSAVGTRLFRWRAGAVEPLQLADPFTGLYAWPHATQLPDGGVALAYDHYQTDARVALGDGRSFGAPFVLGTGVLARVESSASGALVATWQNGFGGMMTVFYRRSDDGVTWTPQASLFDGSTNVHDAVPFRRLDGEVDVYFLAPGPRGFTVRRRRVGATLGPVQEVTADALAPSTQPHPHRLPDGRIALTLTRERTSQVDYDATCVVLQGDAPGR